MRAVAFALGLLLVSVSSASAATCFKISKPSHANMSMKVQQVTCCCRTFNGGSCCAQTNFCGGLVPGCFCQ